MFPKIYLLNLETHLYRQWTPYFPKSQTLIYCQCCFMDTGCALSIFLSQSCASCRHCTLFNLLQVYMHGACRLSTVRWGGGGGGGSHLAGGFSKSWLVILINFVIVVQSSNERELKLNITAIKVLKHWSSRPDCRLNLWWTSARFVARIFLGDTSSICRILWGSYLKRKDKLGDRFENLLNVSKVASSL